MNRPFGLLPFLTLILAGCSIETARQQAAPMQVDRVYQPLGPVVPIAVASKKVGLVKTPTVGLKNPGAQPGQEFGNGGTSECGYRWTSKGWVTACEPPMDGSPNFDIRDPSGL